ncbi:MAG: hypothetical protein QNK30_05180 [Bacteroidales bacterium]|nr:hypothetical protein [Bacteroidales bacterium]
MEILYQEVWDILSNRQSGSVVLLNDLTKAFASYSGRNNEHRQAELKEMIHFLDTGFANFPVILHFLKEFKEFLSEEPPHNTKIFLDRYAQKWQDVTTRLAKQASKIIDFSNKTVLIQSHSGTIQALFGLQRQGYSNIKIIITESRPVMEGRIQAAYLTKLGYEVTFITDSAAALFFPEIDLVVSGADRVCKKSFINKIGSYSLALLAKEFKVPFYLLSDSRKIFSDDSCAEMEEKEKSTKEIWKNPPNRVIIKNYYFESVPNKFVTQFITEEGIWTP